MALMARVSLTGPPAQEPEDFLFSALSVIFPDDAANQHGDADHDVLYTSPHLPAPLHLSLADPAHDDDRLLFAHYLWNASLLLAKLIEAGTVVDGGTKRRRRRTRGEQVTTSPVDAHPDDADVVTSRYARVADFDVTGLATLELGAGTALPSLVAALLGARRVAITDYPSPATLDNLRANVARNVRQAKEEGEEHEKDEEDEERGKQEQKINAANDRVDCRPRNPVSTAAVTVDGHEWGSFDTPFAVANRHAFDRVAVCDCLWMPWQHDNLRRSIDWFLKEEGEDEEKEEGEEEEEEEKTRVADTTDEANEETTEGVPAAPRCWVVAGFHTGRDKVAAFFDEAALAAANLEVEAIWDRDCDDQERPWAADRGVEDVTERKRWLVVAVLRRRRRQRRRSRG